MSNCPLCSGKSDLFFENTFSCQNCFLIFKDQKIFLTPEAENKRYQSHCNIANDEGYINFLNKLAIPLRPFLKKEFHSLDYGCGPYSQMSKLIENEVSSSSIYDPLFFPSEQICKSQFDVVTCTEVVEHFKIPSADWTQLISTVKSEGILGVMTQFYNDSINFKDWWYKNDPTHIMFYREETLEYMAAKFQLKILYNDHRSVIIFRNG
jgi:hypothetical protein